MPDPKPASWDDVISAAARANGVNPALALAVAEQESGFDPQAKSPKGALGIMQLMPATAAELGVDPNDPVANITGGVKYLKQLSDKYDGDLERTLSAYNFGPGNVDKGAPLPPETTAYISSVMAGLSKRARSTPSAPAQPVSTTVPPLVAAPPKDGPGFLRTIAESFNPMKREGAANVGSTVGGLVSGGNLPITAAMGAAGGGFHDLISAIPEIPGAVRDIAANVADGYGAETLEGAKAGASEGLVTSGVEAAKQAAYEVGGRVIMWPLKSLGKSVLATKVGKTASTALKSGVDRATTGAREMLEAAKGRSRELVDTATDKAGEAATATREAMEEFMQAARSQASKRVSDARGTARRLRTAATQHSASTLADTELAAADAVTEATKAYDSALAKAPVQAAVASSTKEVLAGLPGGATRSGPAKRALDAVGKNIDAAAKTGPEVAMAPIKLALRDFQNKLRPASLFPAKAASDKVVGFGPKAVQNAAPLSGMAAQMPGDRPLADIVKQYAGDLGLPDTHPLPGILAQVQTAPEKVTFETAHQLKRLLDEAVNWDGPAKKHLAAMTKGIRTVLREKLAVHEPYNAATQAYAELVPLYRKGAGKKLIKAAMDDPDKIASLLKPTAPNDAAQIRRLLVDQAAAGGDDLAGLRAWDQVRSTFTYDKVLAGGPEKLSRRIAEMETQHPEFVKTLYGDESGSMILGNLKQIGKAFDEAVARGGANVEAAKGAGAALKTGAAETGASWVENAKVAEATSNAAASRAKREAVRARRIGGKQDVAAARSKGAADIKASRQAGQSALEQAKSALEQFTNSSMNRFAARSPESVGADVIRMAAIPRSMWGAISMVRLLRAPKSSDLIQAAAYSPEMTQRLVRVLTGHAPDQVAAALIRDLATMASGESVPTDQKPDQVPGEMYLTIGAESK